MYCQMCGRPMQRGARYCAACGALRAPVPVRRCPSQADLAPRQYSVQRVRPKPKVRVNLVRVALMSVAGVLLSLLVGAAVCVGAAYATGVLCG